MQGKMQALMKATAAPGAELVTVDIPQIGPRDVLIKVTATAICGTDVHIYTWNPWAEERIKAPLIFGHEFAGNVVEVGDQVDSVKIGDYVSAEGHFVCGRCLQCRMGQAHVCQNLAILGVDTTGCFAEYVRVPAENVWQNDPTTPPELCAVQDPMGNAVHTVFAGGDVLAKSVAVIGCGPIGIFAVAVARAAAAAKVFAIEPNAYRAELARKLGADRVIDPTKEDPVAIVKELTDGGGVDVMLEMSGNARAIDQGFKMLRFGGRAALLGLPDKPIQFDLNNNIVFKGAEVYGVTGRRMWDTWYKMRGLFQSGKLDITPVITHKLPMSEFKQGFDLMLSGNCGKVVLYPGK
jgi:threonine 3-dehydrogenase